MSGDVDFSCFNLYMVWLLILNYNQSINRERLPNFSCIISLDNTLNPNI